MNGHANKKKEAIHADLEGQKKLQIGEIRVKRNILFFSENKCSILSDVALGKPKLHPEKQLKTLACFFFFCVEKLERTSKQKKETKC